MDPLHLTRIDAHPLVFRRRLASWQVALERVAYSSKELAARYDRSAVRWPRRVRRLGFDVAYAWPAGWFERTGLTRLQAVPVAGLWWCGRPSLAFVAHR